MLYHSDSCPHCADAKKLVEGLRKTAKTPIREVAVESCSINDPFCKGLEFVPTFANCSKDGCVEVSPQEFIGLAKNGRKK